MRRSEKALKEKTVRLNRANAKLHKLLEQSDKDKTVLEADVMSNIKESIVPYFELLRGSGLTGPQHRLLRNIDTHINEMTAPVLGESMALNLTPTEHRIIDFIRLGKTSKEIAATLKISVNTVATHRRNIRKKMGLKGGKGNLKTQLMSISLQN